MAVVSLSGQAQSTDSVRTAINPRTPSWHLQVSTFYSSADNGFGVWKGQDIRLLYSSSRLSPFIGIGSQSRVSGNQQVYGGGSYINITPWMYAIVGLGMAPDRGAILFPRLRSDIGVFVAVPKVKGLLVTSGITDLRYQDKRAGGRIVPVGAILYHGRAIYSGSVYLNQDRASGARSTAWQAGGQWGAQGQYWVGGSFGAGNEAYRLLSATPFDARFKSQFVSAFASKWLTTKTGVSLRFDYEHKDAVFNRQALGLSYFVDF